VFSNVKYVLQKGPLNFQLKSWSKVIKISCSDEDRIFCGKLANGSISWQLTICSNKCRADSVWHRRHTTYTSFSYTG